VSSLGKKRLEAALAIAGYAVGWRCTTCVLASVVSQASTVQVFASPGRFSSQKLLISRWRGTAELFERLT